MKSVRLSDELRSSVASAVDAATNTSPMAHDEEVRSLMAKGMKIAIARGHCVWAFAPRKIAQVAG